MPKPLAKFVSFHFVVALKFAFLRFIQSAIAAILGRLAGVNPDTIAVPLRVLIIVSFALWAVYFVLRLLFGIRSGRLSID